MLNKLKCQNLVFLIYIFFGLTPQLFAFECASYLVVEAKPISPYTQALKEYSFPEDANFFVFERIMRIAIHEAHEGLDFYTGLPLSFDEMTLDHIIPRSKSGPDNVFNFVPTSSEVNSKKGSKFEAKDLETLEQVRSIFGPKTMALLRHYGAFENREEDFEKAKMASNQRRVYRRKHQNNSETLIGGIVPRELTIFRRNPERPSKEVLKLIWIFAYKLSELNEKDFETAVANRSFQFEIEERIAPAIEAESISDFNLTLSQRKVRAKIDDESLSMRSTLFEIVDYDLIRGLNRRKVTFSFHPMFALKLLEMPVGQVMGNDFLDSFFRPTDISRDEYVEWAE